MKLFINRQVVDGPYGGGNQFLKAFFGLAPKYDITIGTRLNQKYDVAFLMDPRPDDTVGLGIEDVLRYKSFQSNVKIVQRVNECDARKQTTGVDQMLNYAGRSNDFTFFVSNWMRDYHAKRKWPCKNSAVVINGVDKDTFRPRHKLNNGKVNIVTAHWSDNPYKGADVQQWLDSFVGTHPDEFAYTYVGRHQNDFKHTKHVEPLFGEALGDEIAKHDICVTASRADPGPNHCLEAIACGLPTYVHFEGGGCVEFAGEDHVYKTAEELETLLLAKKFEKNALVPASWEECMDAYFLKIREVMNG